MPTIKLTVDRAAFRALLLTIVVVALAGCGSMKIAQMRKAAEMAKDQLDLDRAACEAQHPGPKISPLVRCEHEAIDAYNKTVIAAGYNIDRTIDAAHHARRELAAKSLDDGKITVEEYRVIVTNSAARANKEDRDRHHQIQRTQAAQDQASAAARQAASAAAASTPTRTNCTTIGNSVNCTSY